MTTLGDLFPHLKADPRFAEVAAKEAGEAMGPTLRPAPDLSIDRAILRCEHKGPPACSCNAVGTCALGKGRAGQVVWQDCRSCQAEARAAT